MYLERIFCEDQRSGERDKFLSRFFGIFSENIVRIWCRSQNSSHSDLGRPTIKPLDSAKRGRTLDFTLRDKTTGDILVTEMKCEIQFQNYKYLKLDSVKQVKRHEKKEAFDWFLKLARNPSNYLVTIKKKEENVNGAALIWGAMDDTKKKDILAETALKDILSVDKMIHDLIEEDNKAYKEYLSQLNTWTNTFFKELGTEWPADLPAHLT